MEKREKPIPPQKLALVKELSGAMKKHKTTLIASCKGLPSSQFHDIKKKLRSFADMKVVRKSTFLRAVEAVGKDSLNVLKNHIDSNFVIFFSDKDAFELSSMLTEIKSVRKAKPGEIAPEDLVIEPGPTDLVPGPAISELSSVGLKVIVKDGKLEIQKGATVVKAGQPISANVSGVLSKLNVSPIRVGFRPIAAYDREADKVYTEIIVDKEGVLDNLKDMIKKALGFAAKIGYPTQETIAYLITKAGREEIAIENLVQKVTKEGA